MTGWTHFDPEIDTPPTPDKIVEGFCVITGSWGTPCPASMVPWSGVNHVIVYRIVTDFDTTETGRDMFKRAFEVIQFYAQGHPAYYYCTDYLDEGAVIQDKGKRAREFLESLPLKKAPK